MNKFLIFFKSGQDQLSRVFDIVDQAEACRSATGKSFNIRHVDVSDAGDPDLPHWSGQRTIECVTVVNNAVFDRRVSPPPVDIGVMVRNLP
ncbi:MAG TPA: hypothetical protein VLE22_05915 [Bryobacteraceae bacterium]|nr:hypothetical protein [Bryobacteraceae bacterium]